MMVYVEILQEIERLPLEDRLKLLEVLTRSVRESLAPRLEQGEEFTARRMRGILKTEAPATSDAELKEDYVNYLIEKYLS